MDDVSTVIKAQNGNVEAFTQLINFHQERLYRIAYTYMKNEQDALDIVSDTVYKAFMGIKKLKEPQYFHTWITKILINSAINKLKVNNKIAYIDEYEKVTSKEDYASDIDLEVPRNIDLYNAIDKLDIKARSIIILRYLQDMSISQISEILQIPPGTIKASIHRSLKKLKYELEEECI